MSKIDGSVWTAETAFVMVVNSSKYHPHGRLLVSRDRPSLEGLAVC